MSKKFVDKNTVSSRSLNLDDYLLNEDDTAAFLQVSKKTLQNWRGQGRGPLYVKLSAGAIRYQYKHLSNWIDQRSFQSTSEAGRCL